MKLSEILKKYRIETKVKDEIEYNQVTISQHTGVKYRGKKLGITIGRKRQFIVDLEKYPNTVMFTRQGLKDGAIGFAPKEVHNCIVTENMPTLSVNTHKVDVDYLKRLLKSNYFLKKISELTIVGSAQKSIHERDLLKLDINIPEIEIQKIIADNIISKEADYFSLTTEIQNQKQLLTQLKQSILQEAIQGKLTADWREQNPNIEPASELLKRIKAEKNQLIKDKKLRKEKALPPINEEEIPFGLPDGWVWCRIGDITTSIVPNRDKPKSFTGNIPWITQTNFEDGVFKLNYKNPFLGLSIEEVEKYNARIMPKNSVVMSCVGVFDIVVVPDKDIVANQQLHCFTLYENTEPLYLAYVIRILSKLMIKHAIHTTIRYLNKTKCESILLPLAPLEEQKAIVEKVESLMQKCQALEQEIKTSEDNAQMLMLAVLKESFESEKEVVEA